MLNSAELLRMLNTHGWIPMMHTQWYPMVSTWEDRPSARRSAPTLEAARPRRAKSAGTAAAPGPGESGFTMGLPWLYHRFTDLLYDLHLIGI